MNSKTREEFLDDLDDFDIAMLATRDGKYLRSRPMAPHIDESDGTIRFITSRRTHKVEEVRANPDANAVFSDEETWISVSGPIHLSENAADVDELWSPAVEAWFREGKAEAVVLILQPEIAEYWDYSENSLKAGWEMVKGALSDKQPDVGENRKMSL